MPRFVIPAAIVLLAALAALAVRPTAAQPPAPPPAADLVLFSSDRDGRFQPYVMNLDGSGVRRVADIPGMTFENALTCEGRIALVTEDPIGSDDHEIWTLMLDGSGLTLLAPGPGDHMPTWRPDGFQVAFSSHRSGDVEIFLSRSS
jgi:Tol biopolymer transport system component